MATPSERHADVERCGTDQTALGGRTQPRMRTAIEALDFIKDVYAQELLRLRTLREGISIKPALQMLGESSDSTRELPPCPTLLQTLVQEREILGKELQDEKARCEELQKQLEQVRAETREAHRCVNVLDDTIRAAFQGEKFLIERNRHLVSDQQLLASKLNEVSKTYLSSFRTRIKDMEATCNSMKPEEVAPLQLYNKVRARGLWVFVELVFFCHAFLWVLVNTVKGTYNFTPT